MVNVITIETAKNQTFICSCDFGNQIKVRSKAKQTMLVQLASDKMGYLPTAKAEERGGYGTSIFSCLFDHTGGEMLVEKTLEVIDSMFD